MDYIIIKLYLNELNGDFHDVNAADFELAVKELRDVAAKSGRKLYFVTSANDGCVGLPVSCTPFAEIEYTGSIEADEKEQYIELLKRLSMDAETKGEYLESFKTLTMVKFKKTYDEIIEIS